jgi:invasion protein IalB
MKSFLSIVAVLLAATSTSSGATSSIALAAESPALRDSVAPVFPRQRSATAVGRYAQANPPAQPAPQAPPMPQRTEILRFDNWTVTCLYFTEGPKKHVCSAGLQVQVQQSGNTQTLLAWTIYLNDSNQFVTNLQTPTGISIPPGVRIEFDKKAGRTLPFDSCDTGHCTAISVMDSAFIHDLSGAQSAEIVIHAQNGKNIQFDIPIKGFDKAYAQLKNPP